MRLLGNLREMEKAYSKASNGVSKNGGAFAHAAGLQLTRDLERGGFCTQRRNQRWLQHRFSVSVNRNRASKVFCLTPLSTGTRNTKRGSPEDAQLKFYNTLSKCKEPFSTIQPGVVKFYSCGPTVYDFAHIGNFRAFLTYDVIKRWLLSSGYEVQHIMNLTDIDDKIIRRVRQTGCSLQELTNKFADAFFEDLNLLNIVPANHYPRATEHINDIEDIVTNLQAQGFAYQKDGSIYFSVSSFPKYGSLVDLDRRKASQLAQDGADNGTAPDADEYEKEDLRDFALWKAWKEEDGEIAWESSLGRGRPGWHIECSCMAIKFLGPEIDIHGGGVDLVFPHHENEIAQSEAHSGGRPFARFWMHNGFVNIDNEKMSKSLGNFRTLRDIVRRPIDARAFRYMVVVSQYRSALAFTDQCLDSARSAIKRIDALRARLETATGQGGEAETADAVADAERDFVSAMNDDLNTPRAAAAMFSLVNVAEKLFRKNSLGEKAAAAVIQCLDRFDAIFGISYVPEGDFEEEEETETVAIPSEVTAMLEERNVARSMKDFELADSLRDRISSAGFLIVDTPTGAVLERKAK